MSGVLRRSATEARELAVWVRSVPGWVIGRLSTVVGVSSSAMRTFVHAAMIGVVAFILSAVMIREFRTETAAIDVEIAE